MAIGWSVRRGDTTMSFLRSFKRYWSIVKRVLRYRIGKHKKWYALWILSNTLIPLAVFLITHSLDIARRVFFLVMVGMVIIDEYHVMGHGLRLRDLFGCWDSERKMFFPTHELIALILFLLSLI
jgi:hypothetical protein